MFNPIFRRIYSWSKRADIMIEFFLMKFHAYVLKHISLGSYVFLDEVGQKGPTPNMIIVFLYLSRPNAKNSNALVQGTLQKNCTLTRMILLKYQTCTDDFVFVWLVVFNATFNNISVISWWSDLLVEETGGPEENHRPVTSHSRWNDTNIT